MAAAARTSWLAGLGLALAGLGLGLALALALTGCSKPAPAVDCSAVVNDPAHGLDLVTSQTEDPARVWGLLEGCFAPDGDACERAAVGGAMVPSMAVSDGSAGDAARRAELRKQWAARCRSLPPEQQRCLQISYQLAHPECAPLVAAARAKLPQAQ